MSPDLSPDVQINLAARRRLDLAPDPYDVAESDEVEDGKSEDLS